MFAFKSGIKPAKISRAVVARAAAMAAISGLAGCASTHSSYTAENVPVAPAQAMAQVAAAEVEDDGRPPQALPSDRLRRLPDEPDEPYSKNYGGINPSRGGERHDEASAPPRAIIAPPAVKIPNDLPAAFRKKLMQAMASDE
jgi:hypothetical protein